MKRKLATLAILIGLTAAAKADLYYVGDETLESLPIKWTVGGNLIYDDNVLPGLAGTKEDSFAIDPYVGASWVSVTPQTTLDIYARLGVIYYFDAPAGADDVNAQSRLGVNVTHHFSERLRLVSRNFISYELEPDYSYAYANSRLAEEYFYWQTDNAIGYRWTERFATYTGFKLNGVDYSGANDNDRFIWMLYNQFRYQLTPQSVLTAEYRYSDTSASGVARDSKSQYGLVGIEHRFSPTTIGIVRAGIQHRDVTNGSDHTRPYLEFALNSQINQQFRVRAFTRYSMESYDTVRTTKGATPSLVEYDQRNTLRIGVNGEYSISPTLSVYGGLDYIPSTYKNGILVTGPGPVPGTADEDIITAHIGVSMRFMENLYGTLTYSYTDSSSDLAGRDYERNRISLGVRAEF